MKKTKKWLSLLLSTVMLFSVGIVSATAAPEEENLCEVFEDLANMGFWDYPTSPFRVETIVKRTGNFIPNYEDYYGEVEDESGEYTYSAYIVPADVMDMYVDKCFALDEDFRTLVEQDENEYTTYNETTNEYFFDAGGYGGPGCYWHYELIGYTKETDTYSVYIQKMPDLYKSADDALSYNDFTEEEIGDRLKQTEGGQYYIEIPKEEQENIKITVSYDGEFNKIFESVKIDSMPAISDLITPEPPSDEDTPKVEYDTPEGVQVEGDNVFPNNTVIKVENVRKGEIFERAEKSLSNVAVKDKIAVFEFTATANNAPVQPNGKVKVSFDLPTNLSADNLKMFYVAEDGKNEEVNITVNKENKTVVAELEHFSTYVLCNVKPADSGKGEGSDSPPTEDTTNTVLFVVMMFVSLSAFGVLAYSKKKQHNH